MEFDARQSNLSDLAKYAPGRIVLAAVLRLAGGLLVLGMGALILWIGVAGDGPKKPGDTPPWMMSLLGAAIATFGFALLSGSVGRLLSAFASDCYFRVGVEGIAVRVPKEGWFGIFKVVEYQYTWEKIERIYSLTHRVNLIPIGTELHIRLFGGQEVVIPRFRFSTGSKRLAEGLLEIQAQVGK